MKKALLELAIIELIIVAFVAYMRYVVGVH